MSEIASRVKAIIVDKLGVDENEVTETANFTQDLGADSLDTVELIMEFEKEFGINIPDDQAQTIATVGDAISYIEKAEEASNYPPHPSPYSPRQKGTIRTRRISSLLTVCRLGVIDARPTSRTANKASQDKQS